MRKTRKALVLLVVSMFVALFAPPFARTAYADSYAISNKPGLRYGGLGVALDDVVDGGTITLLEDTTRTDDYLVLLRDINVTLDLNGHVLTTGGYKNNVSDYYGIEAEKGTITIKNGTIRSTQNHTDPINSVGGTIILGENLKVESATSVIQARSGGKVIIDGADITCKSTVYAAAFATGASSSIELRSGSISQSSGTPVTLSVKGGATATISGGRLYSGSSTAMVSSGVGSLITVTGGTVANNGANGSRTGTAGYWVAQATEGGRIIQKGGTIESAHGNGLYAHSNKAGGATVEIQGGTVSAEGYALLASGDSDQPATATISDGTLHGMVGAGIGSTGIGGNSLTITGGTVDGAVKKGAGTVAASGGIFTKGIAEDCVASGYAAVSTGNSKNADEVKVVKKWDVTVKSIADHTYTGESISPQVVVTSNKDGSTVPARDYDVSFENNVNAGTASVHVTCKSGDNVGAQASATFVIEKRPVLVQAKDASKTFGQKDPTFTASAGAVEGVAESGLVYGHDLEASVRRTSGENTGAYVLTVGTVAVKNQDGKDITANYDVRKAVGVFIIRKANATAVAPQAIEGLAYTGKAQALVTAGSATDGELQYSLDGESYTDDVPTATDAGVYTVYWRVLGDRNHNDVEGETLKVSIAQASIKPEVTLAGWTYGDAAEKPALAEGANPGDAAVTYAYKPADADDAAYAADVPTSVGDYVVRATVAATKDYKGGTATADFTIAKRAVTVTAKDQSITYGQAIATDESAYTLARTSGKGDALASGDVATVTLKASTAEVTSEGVITPSLTVTRDGKDVTANYDVTTVNGTLVITAADPEVTAPEAREGLEYTGDAQALVEPGIVTGGEMQYALGNGGFSTEVPTGTDAGTYKVRWRVVGDEGHNDVAGDTIEVRIAKAPIDPEVSLADWTYGDAANEPTLAEGTNPGSAAVTYRYRPAGSASSAYTADVPTEAGDYIVRASVAATKNYEGATATARFTIEKRAITVTAKDQSITYGQAIGTGSDWFTLRLTSGEGRPIVEGDGAVVTLKASTTDVTEAGTITPKVTISRAGEDVSANYEVTLVKGKLVIAKASIEPQVSLDGWTYGDAANEPALAEGANPGGGAVTYAYKPADADDAAYAADVPTSVGDYVVRATVAATKDYKGGTATADFTIAKRAVTVTAKDQSITYGQSIETGSDWYTIARTSGEGAPLAEGDEATVTLEPSTNSATDAGTIAPKVAISRAGTDVAANYDITTVDGKLVIAPAKIVITADNKYGSYGNEPKELTWSVSGDHLTEDDLGVVLSCEVTKSSPVGRYPISITWNENPNYAAELKEGTYTISSAPLEISVTGYEGVYDGAAHGVQVSVPEGIGATVWYATEELNAENYSQVGTTEPITRTEAGETMVYCFVTADNYDTAAGSARISITQADNSVICAIDGWIYGETPHEPAASLCFGTASFGYAAAPEGPFAPEVPTQVGTWYVRAEVAASESWAGATSEPVAFEIAPAEIEIVANDVSGVYGEARRELSYSVSGGYVEGDDLGVTFLCGVNESTPVGAYLISLGWNENPNYIADLRAGTYSVTNAQMDVTATGYDGTYDGASHGISVEVGEGLSATVWYATEPLNADNYQEIGSTEPITRTDVGTTTVYYLVVAENYDIVAGSASISIAKAVVTDPGQPRVVDGLVYTGSEQELVSGPEELPAGLEGIEYSVGSGETWTDWSDTLPTGVDAGAYTVRYRYIADENHVAPAGSALVAHIDPAGTGSVESEVVVEDGAPALSAPNLPDVAPSLLSDEENAAVKVGAAAKVRLVCSPLTDATVPAQDNSVLRAKLVELDAADDVWFDLSLYKTVTGFDEVEIHETGEALQLAVYVPEELLDVPEELERTFYLLRAHEGAADVVAEGAGPVLEWESDRFSTYVLAYKDTLAEGHQGGSGGDEPDKPGKKPRGTNPGTPARTGKAGGSTLPITGDDAAAMPVGVQAALGAFTLVVGLRKRVTR